MDQWLFWRVNGKIADAEGAELCQRKALRSGSAAGGLLGHLAWFGWSVVSCSLSFLRQILIWWRPQVASTGSKIWLWWCGRTIYEIICGAVIPWKTFFFVGPPIPIVWEITQAFRSQRCLIFICGHLIRVSFNQQHGAAVDFDGDLLFWAAWRRLSEAYGQTELCLDIVSSIYEIKHVSNPCTVILFSMKRNRNCELTKFYRNLLIYLFL